VEEKNLGIPFRTIHWKRKTIPFQTIFNDKTLEFLSEPFSEEKTLKFCSEQFLEEKKFGIPFPFRTIFGREKLENSFQTIFGNRKHSKKMTFVSCFVKLHYFR
jgi:hypothetical protein